MQRIRVFLSANEPMLHSQYHSIIILYLPSKWWKAAKNELILSCRKLKCQKLSNRKKGPLFFYTNSGKLETTLTPTPYQTRLDCTTFPETFNIPVVMSQPWILLAVIPQLVVMLSFPEALQSCFTDIPVKFNSLLYYTMQYFFCFDQPVIHY